MATLCNNTFLFNPTCDFAVGNGHPAWQANRILQKMEQDLATLPMFLGSEADCVLVDKLPSSEFLDTVVKVFPGLPSFHLKKGALTSEKFINTPKLRLMPWGWSPAAHQLLSPLKASCSDSFKRSPVFNWKPQHRDLYSKEFASKILRTILSAGNHHIFLPSEMSPQVCRSQTEFEMLIEKWGKIMVKAPWSSSGRGLQAITKTPVHPKVWEKVIGMVKEQGYAICEPYLNKALDLAFQFELQSGKVSFLGTSNFTTDAKGQYQGNYLNGFPSGFDKKLIDFALAMKHKIVPLLIWAIENSDLALHYEGYFGVDTLIYYDATGQLKINPCLETNVRQNMGLLSLHLEKLLAPGAKGVYRTWFKPGADFKTFKGKMEHDFPLISDGGRIVSGFLPLVDAHEGTQFGAYILV